MLRSSLPMILLAFLLFSSRLPYRESLAVNMVAEVSLGGTSQNKTVIYADNDNVTFTVTVTTTSDVPEGATAKVDYLDLVQPTRIRA
jgi:hypothetical protein